MHFIWVSMYSSLDKSRQPATRSNTEKDIGSTQTSVVNANNSNGNNIPTDRNENRQMSSKYDTNSGTAAKHLIWTTTRLKLLIAITNVFSESPLSADDYLGNLPIKPLNDVAKSAFGANHEKRNSSYKSLQNNIAGLSSQPLTSSHFSTNNFHSALNEFTPKPSNKRTDQSSTDGTGTEFTPLLKSTQKQNYERPDFDTTLTNKENRLGTKTHRGSNILTEISMNQSLIIIPVSCHTKNWAIAWLA